MPLCNNENFSNLETSLNQDDTRISDLKSMTYMNMYGQLLRTLSRGGVVTYCKLPLTDVNNKNAGNPTERTKTKESQLS